MSYPNLLEEFEAWYNAHMGPKMHMTDEERGVLTLYLVWQHERTGADKSPKRSRI